MKYLLGFLVILLFILHQDYWQWRSTQIVLGFVPYTLLYHVVISLATALVWLMAVRFCWPAFLDRVQVSEKVREQEKSRRS